ncbi:MAG TPA: hypothetical protein PKC89_13850, partial [Pyrinomonadaceae bacterium]|nr:hypothetical protein [Pyrinomonadaceae bacterium]
PRESWLGQKAAMRRQAASEVGFWAGFHGINAVAIRRESALSVTLDCRAASAMLTARSRRRY